MLMSQKEILLSLTSILRETDLTMMPYSLDHAMPKKKAKLSLIRWVFLLAGQVQISFGFFVCFFVNLSEDLTCEGKTFYS